MKKEKLIKSWIKILTIVCCLLSLEAMAQSLAPYYPFDVRLKAYDCENRYQMELPTKDQCIKREYEDYMETQWKASHKVYYETFEALYQDNNLSNDLVVDEIYGMEDQLVTDNRPKSDTTPKQTKISPLKRFLGCIEFVCEAWESECPQYYGTSEGTIDFLKVQSMGDWCVDRGTKLQEYSKVKTDMLLKERMARRALATVEEGHHRSVQIFLGGILPRMFKALREIIDLDRKLDVYVKKPLQKE